MKNKLYYLIPIVFAMLIVATVELTSIDLKPMDSINLSTLFMTFPIILALVERFNELFIKTKSSNSIATLEIKSKNIRNTSLSSFCIGVVLSIVGFRILETFMSVPSDDYLFQRNLFKLADILLTAAVIAGGTDGWHQMVALLSDLTKEKRVEITNKNIPRNSA